MLLIPLWFLVTTAILLILAVILSSIIKLVAPACPSGSSGSSGGGSSGCQTGGSCPTGAQGVSGNTGGTGSIGPTGSAGTVGLSLRPDDYGILTNGLVNSIQSNFTQYTFLVTTDARANQSNPVGLIGDMSRHLILWNAGVWTDEGPYTGDDGPTGSTGIAGTTGWTGITGFSSATGWTGIPGHTGPIGPTGVSQTTIILGSTFGDGQDETGFVGASSLVTLQRDMFYSNLQVELTGVLDTNGYRVFAHDFILNNGTIRCIGTNGSNSNVTGGGFGGTGAHAGSLGGGGSAVRAFLQDGLTGGGSEYALASGPSNLLFKGGPATDAFAGPVTYNSLLINMAAIEACTTPFYTPPGFQISISGGSAGASSGPNDLFWHAQGGGGGGVVSLSTPIIMGSGTVDVSGGDSGMNENLTDPSGGGGGGLIIIRTIINSAAWVNRVSGGRSLDQALGPPYENLSGYGNDGLVIFV